MTENNKSIVENKQVKLSRIKLLLLISIPFALMAAAWTVYYTGVGMPAGTSNQGVLVNPPLQINALTIDGQPPIIAENNTRWSFLLPGPSSCDEACAQRLYFTRQLRTALGKYAQDTQRLYLKDASQPLSVKFKTLLEEEHKDIKIVDVDWVSLQALLASNDASAQSVAEQHFYFADARGFLMLYYTEEHSHKDTMKDIKFLLKYAQ